MFLNKIWTYDDIWCHCSCAHIVLIIYIYIYFLFLVISTGRYSYMCVHIHSFCVFICPVCFPVHLPPCCYSLPWQADSRMEGPQVTVQGVWGFRGGIYGVIFSDIPHPKRGIFRVTLRCFFFFSLGGWIFWSQDTRTNPVDLPVSSFWSRDCSMDFYKKDDENNWAAKEKYCVFRCLISRLQITFHILLVLFMSIWICKHIFIYTYIYVCSREIFWALLVIPLMKQPT